MAMSNKGLTKLSEECGELVQAACKKIAYMDGQHPDKKGDLDKRIEEEMADVLAACDFVKKKLKLNTKAIEKRRKMKLKRFKKWDSDPNS